jgi:NAD(P)H-dependent FMN reductase
MSDLKLAIILGSTRPGRKGKAVADWVLAKAKERTSADYELIDLIDYPLPHMDEPPRRRHPAVSSMLQPIAG